MAALRMGGDAEWEGVAERGADESGGPGGRAALDPGAIVLAGNQVRAVGDRPLPAWGWTVARGAARSGRSSDPLHLRRPETASRRSADSNRIIIQRGCRNCFVGCARKVQRKRWFGPWTG